MASISMFSRMPPTSCFGICLHLCKKANLEDGGKMEELSDRVMKAVARCVCVCIAVSFIPSISVLYNGGCALVKGWQGWNRFSESPQEGGQELDEALRHVAIALSDVALGRSPFLVSLAYAAVPEPVATVHQTVVEWVEGITFFSSPPPGRTESHA